MTIRRRPRGEGKSSKCRQKCLSNNKNSINQPWGFFLAPRDDALLFRPTSRFTKLTLSFNTPNTAIKMKPLPSLLRSRSLNSYICSTCTRQLARQSQRRNYASPSSSSNPEIFDLVCVGGGPAGLSLLAALRISSPPPNIRRRLINK